MSLARKYFTYPFLWIVVVALSVFAAGLTGTLYSTLFPVSGISVGDIGLASASVAEMVGFSINYFFLLSTLFTLFGGRLRVWFVVLFISPYLILLLAPFSGTLILLALGVVATAGHFFALGIQKLIPNLVTKPQ